MTRQRTVSSALPRAAGLSLAWLPWLMPLSFLVVVVVMLWPGDTLPEGCEALWHCEPLHAAMPRLGVGVLVGLLMAAGAGWLLQRRLVAPLRAMLSEFAQSAPDMPGTLPVGGSVHELNAIGHAFNRVQSCLAEVAHTQAQLAESRIFNAAVLAAVPQAVIALSTDRVVQVFNPGACRLTGYRRDDMEGHYSPVALLHDAGQLAERRTRLAEYLGDAAGLEDPLAFFVQWRRAYPSFSDNEWVWRRKDGTLVPVVLTVVEVRTDDGTLMGYVASAEDVSDFKRVVAENQRLAWFDPLTALPNRRLLVDRLEHAMARSQRSGAWGGLLFIDLDSFKSLNDTRGHAAGDLLLQQVAQRLQACVRATDTVARMGGDEFVVLLDNLDPERGSAAAKAARVAEKLGMALDAPFDIGGSPHRGGASIGMTLFPKRGASASQAMREADIAMYSAKRHGRNTVRMYEPAMQTQVRARHELEQGLETALRNGEFTVALQPQVDAGGVIRAVEVLLRWHRAGHEPVSPATFIPVIEEMGLMPEVGEWVLRQGSQLLRRIDEAGYDLGVSVNVSVFQLDQADFAQRVAMILTEERARPGGLTFELTESQAISNVEHAYVTMNSLRALGVRFSLDDFGTGYSSLLYLRRLPFAELKIDQVFLKGVPAGADGTVLIKAIMAAVHHLDLRVVAEGVETVEQFEFLCEQRCGLFQGYYFSPPVSEADFFALVRQRNGPPPVRHPEGG